MAATASLGKKHICAACGTKFYDLGKDPAACPKCGTEVEMEVAPSSVFAMVAPKPKSEKKVKKPSESKELGDMKLTSSIDVMDMLDDSDEDLSSLSELDDRPSQDQHAAHSDDVEESELMDEKAGYRTILDKGDEEEGR